MDGCHGYTNISKLFLGGHSATCTMCMQLKIVQITDRICLIEDNQWLTMTSFLRLKIINDDDEFKLKKTFNDTVSD